MFSAPIKGRSPCYASLHCEEFGSVVSRWFCNKLWKDVLVRIRSIFYLLWLFLLFTWNVLGSLFSIECFTFIDFIPYVLFKTKHNLHLHEYALCICMCYRFTHILYIMLFFIKINNINYYNAFCNVHMQELG